jgi:hypothetical protein
MPGRLQSRSRRRAQSIIQPTSGRTVNRCVRVADDNAPLGSAKNLFLTYPHNKLCLPRQLIGSRHYLRGPTYLLVVVEAYRSLQQQLDFI